MLQLPTLYTEPLSKDFKTDGDKLIEFAEIAWKSPENPDGLQLDEWQKWLLRAILERYPDDNPMYPGRLRYRQVVISVGRQNGKSLIAAMLGLYGLLLHEIGPQCISLASSTDQANIVYNRVLYVINSNQFLKKRFKRATETRGIVTADGGGRYDVKAAKEAALQGIPISFSSWNFPAQGWHCCWNHNSRRPKLKDLNRPLQVWNLSSQRIRRSRALWLLPLDCTGQRSHR
jgi:hypothetical protein